MNLRYLLSCLLCLLPAFATGGETPIALTHATVIDGTGTAPRSDTTIVVEDERIAAVYASGSRPLPDDARVRDLGGLFVIPGLIDAHVHMTGPHPDMARYEPFLRALLRGGVTALRDMGGDTRVLGWLARQAQTGAIASPAIFYAAIMAGPTFVARDPRARAAAAGEPAGFAPWMRAITAATDVPLAVAAASGTGAAGIKLYANLPASLVAAVTAEAHRQGLPVWAHATIFPASPADAVAAGVDVLSHSPYLIWQAAPRVPDDYRVRAYGDFERIPYDAPELVALLDAMKQHGTILDATLGAFKQSVEHRPESAGQGILAWTYAVTELAHERGVLIAAGSDSAGLPMGEAGPDLQAPPLVHREMALLVEHAGFSSIEAIQAATQVGAMALGDVANRGTITPGKRADLVVLTADPTGDIRNTTRIAWVMKGGVIYDDKLGPAKHGKLKQEYMTIPNANTPEPGLVIGGQPSPAELEALGRAGFDLVINLRGPEEDIGFDEAAVVQRLGMDYVNIPVAGPQDVSRENARALHAALSAESAEQVLVHCGSGNRVGALFALRAGLLQGKSDEEALAVGKAHGLTGLEPQVREVLDAAN